MARLTREAIIAAAGSAGACAEGLAAYEAMATGTTGYEWTEECVRRCWERYPQFLRWLERRNVVPALEVEGIPSPEERQKHRVTIIEDNRDKKSRRS